MPSVDLTGRLILSRCDNPADFVVLPMLWESAVSWPVLEGENRPYADGTLRVFIAGDATGPVLKDTWSPQLGVVSAAVLLSLRARVGVPHFARDVIGQRIPCVMWETGVAFGGPARGAAVSGVPTFTLERTDWPEGV